MATPIGCCFKTMLLFSMVIFHPKSEKDQIGRTWIIHETEEIYWVCPLSGSVCKTSHGFLTKGTTLLDVKYRK